MRVIIADDAPAMRTLYSDLLTEAGIHVVALAASADELIAQVHKHQPDAVLLDISFRRSDKNRDGIDAAAQLRADYPALGLLMFSAYMRPVYLARVLSIGESHIGFLGKNVVTDFGAVVEALRTVAAGGTAIDEDLWREMLQFRRARDQLDSLPARQRRTLELVARGMSNKAIARQLGVREGTVEGYLSDVFAFLQIAEVSDVNKRVYAVLAWLRQTGALPELTG